MNIDPSDEPGEHWLGVWLNDKDSVESYDSYAMPPHYYSKHIQHFVRRPILQDTPWALQEYDSSTCGDYALYFLTMRAKGQHIPSVMKQFSRHDYVNNDLKVVCHIKNVCQTNTLSPCSSRTECKDKTKQSKKERTSSVNENNPPWVV